MNKKLKMIGILLVAVLLLGSAFGCKSSYDLSTSKSDISGEWLLDCRYKDTKASKIPRMVMLLDKSGAITFQTYKAQKDKNNPDKIVAYKLDKTNDVEASVSDGSIEYTLDGFDYQIEYKYDDYAKLLHFYYADEKGKLVHEVYRVYDEEAENKLLEEQNADDKNDTNSNQNDQNDSSK